MPLLLQAGFTAILRDIEQSGSSNWAYINVALLNLSTEQQDAIVTYIELTNKKYRKDKLSHDFSLHFQNLNYGITYVRSDNLKEMDQYLTMFCERRLREFTPEFWIGLGKSKQRLFAKLFYTTAVSPSTH